MTRHTGFSHARSCSRSILENAFHTGRRFVVQTAMLLITACGDGAGGDRGNPAAVKPDALNSVSLSPTNSTVMPGATVPLMPIASPGGSGVNVTYVYQSDAANIAAVNAGTGVVTSVAPGTATITVTATGSGSGYTTNTRTATATIVVTAFPNALNNVTLSPATATVLLGTTVPLVPTPSTAGAGVTMSYAFQSDATSVATVNATTGVVTAVTTGNATITVTATGSGAGFTTNARTAQSIITVVRPAPTCVSTVPTGRLTHAGGNANFVYTTAAGWKITIVKGSHLAVVSPDDRIRYESWGSVGPETSLVPKQHESINGQHIKDWLSAHRTLVIPGGAKVTIASVNHAIAANTYPVATVSIYDVDQTHRIDEQTHQVVSSCAIASFEEADEYDGEMSEFVLEPTGWLWQQRYVEGVSGTGAPLPKVPTEYPLARTYFADPNRVTDYYV